MYVKSLAQTFIKSQLWSKAVVSCKRQRGYHKKLTTSCREPLEKANLWSWPELLVVSEENHC